MFIETQFDIHIVWVSFGFSTVFFLNIIVYIYNMYVHIHVCIVYCFT